MGLMESRGWSLVKRPMQTKWEYLECLKTVLPKTSSPLFVISERPSKPKQISGACGSEWCLMAKIVSGDAEAFTNGTGVCIKIHVK